jgi:hypothetical protein
MKTDHPVLHAKGPHLRAALRFSTAVNAYQIFTRSFGARYSFSPGFTSNAGYH